MPFRLTGVQTCARSEEHTSELQSHDNLLCRLLLEKNNLDAPRPRAFPREVPRGGADARGWPPGRAAGCGGGSRSGAARGTATAAALFFSNNAPPPKTTPFPKTRSFAT